MKHNKGFTLIEMMVVVAIVGILMVLIIMPMYQEYTIRARVVEGITMAEVAKVAVSETTTINNHLPADQGATKYITPASTPNVGSIVIGANGVIIITYTPLSGNGTIILTPTRNSNGDLTWDCTIGSLISKYRPAICRP